MGKPYYREYVRQYRRRNGLKLKVKTAITKAGGHKGCFIIKNVVSKEDAKSIISKRPADSSMTSLQGSYRKYDSAGHDSFTKEIRERTVVNWPMKGPESEKTVKFGEFYKLVAECLGMETACVNQHDRIVYHSDKLQVSLLIFCLIDFIILNIIYGIFCIFYWFIYVIDTSTMAYRCKSE
jgi:hypothetical protein